MTYAENLWLFFVFLFGIIIVPGMDMLFVIANALTGGRRAGLCATGGIMAGGAVHAFIGAIGVGILLKWAPSLFALLIFAGAAYMAWIGVTLMRSSIVIGAFGIVAGRSHWVAFRQGASTCLLNPKAYLFTLAVFPQFIRPQYGPLWSQALAMGAMIVLTQAGIYGGLALAAGASRDFIVSTPRATMFVGRAAGLFFIVVAAIAIWRGCTALPIIALMPAG
jgi:threonine/homoserine/homoserine lactone efflux protein